MADNLQYSPRRIIEFLGDTDPEGAIEEWKWWQVEKADLEGRLQALVRELSGEYEQDVMAAAQAMLQQQLTAGPPGGAPPGTQLPEGGGLPAGPGGPLFDPSQGGLPPSVANPEGATFEGANGTDRLGNPIADVPA